VKWKNTQSLVSCQKINIFTANESFIMPSQDPRIAAIWQQIENGAIAEALEALRGLAQAHSRAHLTAVSMQKSELNKLEQEELELGASDPSLTARRKRLQRQLFKLAEAIGEKLKQEPVHSEAGAKGAAPRPFKSARGEGPVNLLLLYAPEDQEGADELRKSMALLLHLNRVELFAQQEVAHGQREQVLEQALQEAELSLLLLSNAFLASPECLQLQEQAYQRQQSRQLALIPVLYAPTAHLDELPIGQLQALPRNGKPITQWSSQDEALTGISQELGELVNRLREDLDYSADAVEQPREPPRPGHQQGFEYDKAALIELFRNGKTGQLIQELVSVTKQQPDFYKQALLLEQRWNKLKREEHQRLATPTQLDVQRNQLHQDLLDVLTDMG